MGLSEERRKGKKIIKIKTKTCVVRGKQKGMEGTGFYINEKLANRVLEVRGIKNSKSHLAIAIQIITYDRLYTFHM